MLEKYQSGMRDNIGCHLGMVRKIQSSLKWIIDGNSVDGGRKFILQRKYNCKGFKMSNGWKIYKF